MGRAEGVSDEKLAHLSRYRESDVYTETEKLAIDLAVAMSATPADVDPDLSARLSAALGPSGLTELAAAIAWENHRARLNRALGVRAMGFSDGAYCVVPEHGPPSGGRNGA